MVCVRAFTDHSSAIVVVVYRPGSVAVQQSFHDELAAVLDRVAIYQEPIFRRRRRQHSFGPRR